MEMNELGGELNMINMERVESIDDAENARMYKKRRLKVLKSIWKSNSIYNAELAEHRDADVMLECLHPNKQLKELQIQWHLGCKPPSWIAPNLLRYIHSIYLYKCFNWSRLSCIAKLPHLKHLSMIGMRLIVIELGDEDTCPSLSNLILSDVSLSFKKSQVHVMMFSWLQEMYLIYCEKLEGLMGPSPLKNLTIKRSDVELPMFLKGLSSLIALNILYQDRFISFDTEVMDSLSSPKQLGIFNCNNFRLLLEGGFPDSLEKLEVVECNQELHARLEDLKSP